MPRVNNVYELPPGTYGVSSTPILSNRYNTFVDDVAADLNAARPITAGGTGATSVIGAYDNLATRGANIASAATLNLNAATGYLVHVTGNTNISAVTLADGKQRMVRFAGTPLITVGANLVGNNGGRDIQVATNDMALFVGHSANVVLFWIIRANGGPVEQEGTTLTLTSTDASANRDPVLIFDRASPSPAADDSLGWIKWHGRTSTGLTVAYAEMWGGIEDPVNGSEDGELKVRIRGSGGLGPQDYKFTRRGFIGTIGDITDPVNGKVSASLSNGTLGNANFGDYSGAPISTLVPGSTTGALIEGQNAAHLVLGIRDNDATDSFSIVSYNGTGAYSKLVAAFRADGTVLVPAGSTFNVGTFSATGATRGQTFDNINLFRSSLEFASTGNHVRFFNTNGQVGSITTGASATAYNISSDELLKEFIGVYDPLAALAIMRADPTREFLWKADGMRAVGWGAQTSYAVSRDLATPGGWFDKTTGLPCDEHDENAEYMPWGVDQAKRTPYLWAVTPWLADRLDDVEARLSAAGL